jgi:predicted MFS family arabinose efflux permease
MVSIKDTFASMGVVLSGAIIIFAVNWNTTFLAAFIISVLVLAYLALIQAPREPLARTRAKEKLHPRFIVAAFKAAHTLRPASYLLMTTGFTAALFYAIIWFVVPLLIADGINANTLSIGLGIFDFAIVILGFTLGRIVDNFNKKLLVLFGIIIFAVAGILLGTNFGFVFLLLGFLATTGDELTGLSLWSWLYSLDKDHKHYGLVTGVVELWADLGWTIGPILAGFLYTTIGPSWTISVGGIIILINLVMYLFMLRNPLPALMHSVATHRHHRQRYHHKK